MIYSKRPIQEGEELTYDYKVTAQHHILPSTHLPDKPQGISLPLVLFSVFQSFKHLVAL